MVSPEVEVPEGARLRFYAAFSEYFGLWGHMEVSVLDGSAYVTTGFCSVLAEGVPPANVHSHAVAPSLRSVKCTLPSSNMVMLDSGEASVTLTATSSTYTLSPPLSVLI